MSSGIFPLLVLNGRPAAGKSEIIDALRSVPDEERRRRFHIGTMEEFDDFPILWDHFEDDDLRESHGQVRLVSETSFVFEGQRYPGYVFKDRYFWRFLVAKICRMYEKRLRQVPRYHERTTAVFEFARGTEHGGLAEAYRSLSDAVLSRAATIYVRVGWEESCRRNQRRRNPERPDSILEHSLEQKKMEMLYRGSDWEAISSGDPGYLTVWNHRVPYVIFENEPEKTHERDLLLNHLETICNRLWRLRRGD